MNKLTRRQVEELRRTPAGSVGNRVAKAIELLGVTQMDLAKSTGQSYPYVSDVARGRYRTITVENAWKFGHYFGCSIADLFPARDEVAA